MKKFFDIAQRAVAVFFTWTAIGIAIYGICTLSLSTLIMAVAWYFVGGGLAIQSIRDIEEATRE